MCKNVSSTERGYDVSTASYNFSLVGRTHSTGNPNGTSKLFNVGTPDDKPLNTSHK
jgi:hypothetical protein